MKADITYSQRLAYLSSRLQSKALILDIGCGNGIFLKKAQKADYRAFGYDIDEMVPADYHSLTKIPNHHFDAITCFDVIEHTPDPIKFINGIKIKLKSKGLLLLTTPNREGIAGKIIKNKFWGISPNGHQKVFNLPELENLLKKSGFAIIEVKTDTLAWWYLTQNTFFNRIINKAVYLILSPFANFFFSHNLGDNLQVLSAII